MKNKKGIVLIIIFAVVFLVTSVLFKVFGITDIWSQLTGTLLGTIITAIVTVLLLSVQTDKEIGHDRDVGIFEKKQEVYFDFIETLEKITQDGRINVPGIEGYIEPKSDDDINDELQHLIYQLGKLQMIATVDAAEKVTKQVGQIISIINNKAPLSIADKYSKFAGQIFQVVSTLRNDMYTYEGAKDTIKEQNVSVRAESIAESLKTAGLDIQQIESNESVLANYCDLLVAEFKNNYHTTATHIELNDKEVTASEAAKGFLPATKATYIQIKTPSSSGMAPFVFELVNDSKYPAVLNQVGLKNKDWPSSHNVKPINFVKKNAAFYEFRDADENGRKQIVKETLQAIEGLEELLKK
ncbi:MAG: phage holin family protein [Treponema sp.]|nr:phage holin family protein [Treponema sp.]